ncbi:hypothetical protein POV27_13620 [Aureisphaera galaxeae]|uniref:hypothetical protein n=1 Tax=Aureisphaera galaxeae TaxID=1538023 RepID=UPI0023502DF2|nr:hypothetical protein [Aureisphaera galaxeae]MDC8005096.1 hypothetical protein [Aureisphaera galaxeae]
MSLKNILFVTLLCFSLQGIAQRNFDENNHLGLQGGFTFFDIDTDNFTTTQGNGYMMGFTTRGSFYNAFDLIYGINFVQNEVQILGRDLNNTQQGFFEQEIDYTIQSAQINILGSFNIVHKHLSLEFGPILNVNGKMKLKQEEFEGFILDGYETLEAKDIQNISRVHFFVAGGITAGLENFRLSAQYQYGVTNIFQRLNDSEDINEPNVNFQGNPHTIIAMAIFYF